MSVFLGLKFFPVPVIFMMSSVCCVAGDFSILAICGKGLPALAEGQRIVALDFINKNDETASVEKAEDEVYCLMALGMHDRAIDLLNGIISKNRKYPFAFQLKSESELALGRYDDSIEDCNQSLIEKSGDSQCYLIKGCAYLAQKKYSSAERSFKVGLSELTDLLPTSSIKEAGSYRWSIEEEKYYLALARLYRAAKPAGSKKSLDILIEGLDRNSLSKDLFENIVGEMKKMGIDNADFIEQHCAVPGFQISESCKLSNK